MGFIDDFKKKFEGTGRTALKIGTGVLGAGVVGLGLAGLMSNEKNQNQHQVQTAKRLMAKAEIDGLYDDYNRNFRKRKPKSLGQIAGVEQATSMTQLRPSITED